MNKILTYKKIFLLKYCYSFLFMIKYIKNNINNCNVRRSSMKKPITVAIAGLGNRGKDTYAQYQHIAPEDMKIVAVADIIREKVDIAKEEFNIPEEMCFNSAEEMLEQPKLADVMIIATQDRQHVGHAIPALEKGYHLLLEKPISPDLDECLRLLETAHKNNRIVTVCHVLRYTPFYSQIKKVLDEGTIGEIMSVQALENVMYWHQAHSFVRGNWKNDQETSPMILQKSCHDMDLFSWLINKKCLRVSSYGSLRHFNKENAPKGAALRCMDGCKAKENCPFDAEKIYVTNERTGIRHGKTDWPCNVLAQHPTEEKIYEAIKTGPYGKCVYACNNNVVDHQVVIGEFEGGATVDFTMCAFTSTGGRMIKIMGTNGDIIGNMETNTIRVCEFGKEPVIYDINKMAKDLSGHGGGDNKMLHDFFELLADENNQKSVLTSIDVSVQSHVMALAAEQSRLHNGKSIELDEFTANK